MVRAVSGDAQCSYVSAEEEDIRPWTIKIGSFLCGILFRKKKFRQEYHGRECYVLPKNDSEIHVRHMNK
jgi:hypothetical protein